MAASKRFKFTRRGVVLLLSFLAILYMGRILIMQQIELNGQRATALALEESIEAADKKNKQYRRELDFTKTDAYIERVAHAKLGFVREGEYKFVESKLD